MQVADHDLTVELRAPAVGPVLQGGCRAMIGIPHETEKPWVDCSSLSQSRQVPGSCRRARIPNR
jgi:hypothetical protein